MKYVQFSDETQTTIIRVFGSPQDPSWYTNLGEVEDDDPRYLAYLNPQPSTEELAASARKDRDSLLRDICDTAVLMIQRELRMTVDTDRITYLNAKLVEVDEYAVALQNVPEQEGFPQTIVWPVAPTR
jgi:hypothetical protein